MGYVSVFIKKKKSKKKNKKEKQSSLLTLLLKQQPVLLLSSVPQGVISRHHAQTEFSSQVYARCQPRLLALSSGTLLQLTAALWKLLLLLMLKREREERTWLGVLPVPIGVGGSFFWRSQALLSQCAFYQDHRKALPVQLYFSKSASEPDANIITVNNE